MTLYNLLAEKETIVAITAAVFVIAMLILAGIISRRRRNEPNYTVKESLMSETEIKYYDALCSIIGDRFILLPQINLASVIDKESEYNTRTELFRNVDFGVFDYDFKPILLIEINDNTHFRKDRMERDKKVASILKKAKLPLVTFWVKDGLDAAEMKHALSKYIKL